MFFKNRQLVLLTSIRKSHIKAKKNAYISICLVAYYWVRFPHQPTQKMQTMLCNTSQMFSDSKLVLYKDQECLYTVPCGQICAQITHLIIISVRRVIGHVFLILIIKAYCIFTKIRILSQPHEGEHNKPVSHINMHKRPN